MGHTRLGTIPKSRKWAEVVSLVSDGQPVPLVASHTLDAAAQALHNSKNDPGLLYSLYLLTQIVLAAREEDWLGRLKRHGLHLPAQASILDLVGAFHAAVDDFTSRHGQPSDISEMAQQAAGEALLTLAADRSRTLFGTGAAELQAAVRELSTRSRVARLGQVFFGRFLERFLDFYLSRVVASRVGTVREFTLDELSEFACNLRTHCEQTAAIVRDFYGGWVSKTHFTEGIDLHNTSRFVAVALEKLGQELNRQKAER